MKLLILIPELFRTKGGMQIFNQHFIKALSQWNKSLFIINLSDKKIHKSKLPSYIKFIPCGSKSRKWSRIRFVVLTFWYIIWETPDFIICGHINFSPICLIIKSLFGVKYGILTYGIEVWEIRNILKKKSFPKANFIVSISNYTISRIKMQIPNIEDKMFLLSNPINGDMFFPKDKSKLLIQKYNLSGFKILLSVARLSSKEKYKGYDTVIKAIPEVKKSIPNLKYILVGKGDDISRVKKLAQELGVLDSLIFTGFVRDEEIVDYYNLCDLFILPSKGEGFGFVFLEALACGKPVIGGNRDGTKDALLNGKLGILVDPDNVEEIKNAIIKVLRKEVEARLLDKNYLRKKVLTTYGIKKFNSKVKTLFEKIKES
jgi:glycosyltransferase involved in cell wall biosynthesis